MHSYKVAALLVSGLLAGLGGCSRHANHEADERYIVDGERQWAESVASGDTAVVERLLAEDYLGVAPDGTLRTKQAEIAGLRSGDQSAQLAQDRCPAGLVIDQHMNIVGLGAHPVLQHMAHGLDIERRAGQHQIFGHFTVFETDRVGVTDPYQQRDCPRRRWRRAQHCGQYQHEGRPHRAERHCANSSARGHLSTWPERRTHSSPGSGSATFCRPACGFSLTIAS